MIHITHMNHLYVWHDMCDMTHSYVWHDSCICVTWITYMCDMTQSNVYVKFDDMSHLICVTYMPHICHIYATYMCLDTYIYVTHICGIHMSHICVNVTYMCECHIYVWHTCALIDVIFDDMLHIYIYISRIYHIYVPWLIAMRAMNHWFYKKK